MADKSWIDDPSEMVRDMLISSKSSASCDLVEIALPNTDETFEKISKEGLASMYADASRYDFDFLFD